MRKYITWLIIFAIIEISLSLYLTFWRDHFWTAVSNKQSLEFIKQLGVFTGVALCICFTSGISGYLVSLSAIKWREKLNNNALDVTDCDHRIENLNQRIQADCWDYPTLVLNLGFGFCKALSYIIVFCVALALSFSWLYLIAILVYSVIGTLVAKYVAKPLISLNYQQQRAEASYRNNLTLDNFSDCVKLMLGLARKQKHLTYFQQFYSQVGVVVPLMLIAPEYFTTGMTLGALMRYNSTSLTILDNMSFTITSFADINRLLSCRKRLQEAQIL